MKTLQELTLLDKFLFDEAMEDQETYEALLRIILGDEQINLMTEAQTEKELRTMPWLRSIRVDVYSMDTLGTIYNTEMQKERRGDLIRRMRYYQAMIDASLLEVGEVNFNVMKNATVIMIMPFDLFGKDRYVYTFEEVCLEDNSIKMNDGAKRIFINTHGKNKQDVSPEFVALMEFIEYNQGRNSDVHNDNLDKIINRVSQIKFSEKVGVKYMQQWEVDAIKKQETRDDALLTAIRNIMNNTKESFEQVCSNMGISDSDKERYRQLL